MVEQIDVDELKQALDSDDNITVLDVREPWEQRICALPKSLPVPMNELSSAFKRLDKEAKIAVLCHHGVRSYFAAITLNKNGFQNVLNVQGGIDAWARKVDTQMPTY